MSKTWYPVIDEEKCTMCGMCTDQCPHGVYDMKEAPKPVVVFPEGCVQGCTGCGNMCPSDAITYFGDNGEAAGSCGEGCGCGEDCCGGACNCH